MKSVLIVMPTLGEVVQSYLLCSDIKKVLNGIQVNAIAEDKDAFCMAEKIAGIEKTFVYRNDTQADAEALLDECTPLAVFFVENCHYPQLLIKAQKRGVVTLLVSAAMNKNILHHPKYVQCFNLNAYGLFSYIGVKSSRYIKNFTSLGVDEKRIFISGDLKVDARRLFLSENDAKEYRHRLGLEQAEVFIAGSISKDEIKPVMDTCKRLLLERANVKCIVAPRFLDDINGLKEYASEISVPVVTKTSFNDWGTEKRRPNVILLDTFGELGKIYGLADVVFVGGTLKPFSAKPLGHNILEPLFHGKVIVVGPNVKKDRDIINKLIDFWPGTTIKDADGLFKSVSFALSNKSFGKIYAQAVKSFVGADIDHDQLIAKLSEVFNVIEYPKKSC